jgi:signal transduction histidine kinase/predicted CoA-binding protein
MTTSSEFLRNIPLFADLSDSDLEKLCKQSEEQYLKAGEMLFTEGSLGQNAYVIREGQIEIFKTTDGREVQLAVRQPGEVIGEMSLLEAASRNASGRALTDSLLVVISHANLERLLNSSPLASRTLLSTIANRLRNTELLLRQSEKMAQLGTLTAGIAHELNNPSAAVIRGAKQLATEIDRFRRLSFELTSIGISNGQVQELDRLMRSQVSKSLPVDSLARSDRESELGDWLEEHGIKEGWELAPQLVNLFGDVKSINSFASYYSSKDLPLVLKWLSTGCSVYSLLDEINQGAARISEIVKALKSYAYLDQAPVQEVDIHEGLENTLVILKYKLKHGVEVVSEFDPDLPRIQAYGGELNQVWTNIIDNAIDAMDGKGRLTIRTAYKKPWVVVDFEDDGPGIPVDTLPKIFNPFFTTKPIGKGTGLGLNISYNIVRKHGGDIKVSSQPGQTCFEVWLPVDFEKKENQAGLNGSFKNPDDRQLHRILATSHTIAVVGITDKPDEPAHSIPAFLQKHGFRIIPVNPRLVEILGERAYADLRSINLPIDIVLIFRASEVVPTIVDQAIAIAAKTVWMQEGISNFNAAQKARSAGLEMVMDTCIRKTYLRLFADSR